MVERDYTMEYEIDDDQRSKTLSCLMGTRLCHTRTLYYIDAPLLLYSSIYICTRISHFFVSGYIGYI